MSDRLRWLRGHEQGEHPATSEGSLGRRSAPTLGVYLPLLLVCLATVYATFRFEDHPLVGRFGSNLATELLGIVVTLAFVQRLLAHQERAQKLRAAVGALRKGGAALAMMVDTWSVLTKGALDPWRTEYPRSTGQLFAPYYTEELAYLDPGLSPEGDEAEGWLRAAAHQLSEAQRRLRDVILTYGNTLDADYLEALDEIVDDPFIALVSELAAGAEASAHEWRIALNQSRGYREAHFIRLVHAVDLHNRLAREAAQFRSRRLAPRARSFNLQIGYERDLAVETLIQPAWWTAAPAVGALRAARTPSKARL